MVLFGGGWELVILKGDTIQYTIVCLKEINLLLLHLRILFVRAQSG